MRKFDRCDLSVAEFRAARSRRLIDKYRGVFLTLLAIDLAFNAGIVAYVLWVQGGVQ